MLKSSKFAVFTDIHFGIHANNKQFIKICKDTMSWISSYCKENGISDVLFCGDFFDSRSSIDVNTLNAATESLYGMADSGINVTMILGNHDLYLRDSTAIHSLLAFGGHSGIDIVDAVKNVRIGDTCVMLLPWMFGTASNRVEDVPRGTKYVFSHHNFPVNYFLGGKSKRSSKTSDSFVSNTPYEDEFGVQNEILSSVVDNGGIFFSGHIHQNTEVKLPNSSKMIIGGSPYETNWGFGSSECGMYVFDIESDSCVFVPNPHNKKHIELRTSEKGEIELADMSNCIVRLLVDTQEPFDSISKIQSEIRSKNPFIIDNTKYEFETAEFVGKRNEEENPLQSISERPSSKLDYILKAIDGSDFSRFSYLSSGDSVSVSKERIKSIATEVFEKVVAK